MSNYTMDQYTLQSYFKSVCNSFYIVYENVKRLEKEMDELESTCPNEELKMVKSCLQVYKSEEWQQKYIIQKYSKEELVKRNEELEVAKKKYEVRYKELYFASQFWRETLWWREKRNIDTILNEIRRSYFSVIVTRKEEIIALMAYFENHHIGRYGIINTNEQYIKSFPTGEKMYEEFLAAYRSKNDDEMNKVIVNYF